MSERDDFGINRPIDRRDFMGGALAGASAIGLQTVFGTGCTEPVQQALQDASGWMLSPGEFDGFGGEGDYAGHNGNTWNVVNAAHRTRDGFDDESAPIEDTGETVDLVVVGGGPAGLSSAYHFQRKHAGGTCLVLENHGIFGGLAKRNEMTVAGTRLIAPQGSNVFVAPVNDQDGLIPPAVLKDIGIDLDSLEYGPLTGTDKALEFDRTNFVYYYPPANTGSLGFFFASDDGYQLVSNPWANGFDSAPISGELKSELMRWRFDTTIPDTPESVDGWLDSMTYQQYLQNVHGFSSEFCELVNNFIGGGKAFNGEMCSAYALSFNRYPGLFKRPFQSLDEYYRVADAGSVRVTGFPGGNGTTARFFANRLVPGLIADSASPADIIEKPIDFSALDRSNQPTRIRLGATVVAVRHVGPVDQASAVDVVYEKGGRLYRVRAKGVAIAAGSWIAKYLTKDAPAQVADSLGNLLHAPMLVANVALNNWRFMEKAGVTSCLWDSGEFGFQCNLRRPMHHGDYRPPLDPNKPIFLTFYAPFIYPGDSAPVQVTKGRAELFGTSFQEFEARLRRQLAKLFGPYGFDPARDIEGIILNRWGHAYVVPEPGFYFGRDGAEADRDVLSRGYGRVRFAHSELTGFQSYESAYTQSERAVNDLLSFL